MENYVLLYFVLCLVFIFISWYLYRVIMRWFHDMLQCMNTAVRNIEKISEKINSIEEKVSSVENYYMNYSENTDENNINQ